MVQACRKQEPPKVFFLTRTAPKLECVWAWAVAVGRRERDEIVMAYIVMAYIVMSYIWAVAVGRRARDEDGAAAGRNPSLQPGCMRTRTCVRARTHTRTHAHMHCVHNRSDSRRRGSLSSSSRARGGHTRTHARMLARMHSHTHARTHRPR